MFNSLSVGIFENSPKNILYFFEKFYKRKKIKVEVLFYARAKF